MKRTIADAREAGLLLGPLFYEFCCRLYWISSNYDPAEDALLFMARGGLRLQYLYELFLGKNGLDDGVRRFPFWISRFAADKLTFTENPELAAEHIVREFSYADCRTMAAALLPDELYPDKAELLKTIPPGLGSAAVTRERFFELYYHSCPYSEKLRGHFRDQRSKGMEHLKARFGAFRYLHTVDTGWFGSTLGSLQTGCRDWQWDALYFGRWNYRETSPWYFNDIVGLMIDAVGLEYRKPIDVMLEYHHILEAVLEPELPSTEYYLTAERCNSMIPGWEARIRGGGDEPMWEGVKAYFESAPPRLLPEVTAATQKALKVWRRVLRYPTPAEARILEVPPRSADFGKHECTPVFGDIAPTPRAEYWKGVKRSLWPAGAIAVTSKHGVFAKQLFWHTLKKLISYRGAV